jgi:thiamine-monophosphate kinase
MANGEFAIIERFFTRQPIAHPATEIGIGDDCAVLYLQESSRIALTTDTLVSGIHFLPDVDPCRLGHKSLAVNLSDLAAMGATPRWALLSLTLPEDDANWLEGFATGFFRLAERYRVQLIGGDTTRGPLAITVQALGVFASAPPMRRFGARPGEGIYVTGHLGSAGLGLKIRRREFVCPDSEPVDRLEIPEPRVGFGAVLSCFASACIDISDGLAADLGHILRHSGVGAEVHWELLPLSAAVRHYVETSGDATLPLTAGDDYELCFTMPRQHEESLRQAVSTGGVPYTWIGSIEARPGLRLSRAGKCEDFPMRGYDHFGSQP